MKNSEYYFQLCAQSGQRLSPTPAMWLCLLQGVSLQSKRANMTGGNQKLIFPKQAV